MKLRSFLFLIFSSIAWFAQASPDRVFVSEDRIMAANQTHLYVLRHIADHAYIYGQELHDQHLIEINLETGAATRYWPLRRATLSYKANQFDLYTDEVHERTGSTHNIMEILRETRAEPLWPTDSPTLGLSLKPNGLTRTHDVGARSLWSTDGLPLRPTKPIPNGGELLMSAENIKAVGRTQLAIMEDIYPPSDIELANEIMFHNGFFERPWSCTLRPEGAFFTRTEDRLRIVKIDCEDSPFWKWSFHVIIPEELKN